MLSPKIALLSIALLSFALTKPGNTSQPQALNPPHLSEMPSVDRVLRAMQTADPRDTAERQVGAFYQLMEIVKTLSGNREFRGMTPDEMRIMQMYSEAQYSVSQAIDKALGRQQDLIGTNQYRYGRWDRRFGIEGIQTFKTFFSPALKAEFDKIIAGDNARREARNQSYQNQRAAQTAQSGTTPTPGSQAELKKCIESGRSQRICFSESMSKGFDQMTGISMQQQLTPGLRMTGDYSSATGFRLIFLPYKVTMSCRGVPSPRLYSVELTDTQVLVKVDNESKAIAFAMRPDGKLAGSGTIRVTGQVPSGSHSEATQGMTTQKTTRTRELLPGEERYYPNANRNGQVYTVEEDTTQMVYGPTGSRTVTDYVTKTADCNIGLMTPIGPTPLPPDAESPFGLLTMIASGTNALMNGASTQEATKKMMEVDKAPAPGLRMTGRYAGANGFSITFHSDSATLACGDVEHALDYSIQRNGSQTFLKILDKANPLTLQLKSDGSLQVEGSVQVNGRVITGTTEDPNNPYVFAPRTARCEVGTLVAGGSNGPAPSTAVAATSSSTSRPAPATGNATPAAAATPAQAAGNVSLSIASGFPTQPGGVNPLAGKTVLILKESFEDILVRAGGTPPGSYKAVTVWARACETRSPACQVGVEAMRPYVVASGKLDGNGAFTFPNARAGVFYLVLQINYNGQHLVWNLRMDLKPGANSVTLSPQNTTPIDR